MAYLNLSDPSVYDLVNQETGTNSSKVMQNTPVSTQQAPPVAVIKVTNKKTPLFKRNLHGFLLFVAIIVVLALCVYFTIYRLGWGVSECMNKNYHNCAALLTPEVAPLALTGLAALI